MAVNIDRETVSSGAVALWWIKRSGLPWLLLAGGAAIVAIAPLVSRLLLQHCDGAGVCTWSSDADSQVIATCRLLGIMTFVWGLVERVTIVLKPKETV